MSFSRSHRNDRRRRVIRESIAADSDFAVESARAQRRARRAPSEDRSESIPLGYRDPGYSHAVRKTCQHRMVQLIPIRPGSLAVVLGVLWTAWGLLLLAHYFIHVRGTESGRSGLLILQLFDIRSPHSIANWLTGQLWLLTAIVAWMIFRIRQHKLDDYRAKYRVWIVFACIALFSSFDTATSSLFLLGQTIDGWARREIGYGGWPLVLACYASFVAIAGLRLSSELKGVPAAVFMWFAGLFSWACAALLGTGLLKLEWHPGTIDLTVGACWLGGVLLVFQSIGAYLRYCYLAAQKRFLERAVMSTSRLQLGIPSLPRMPWSRSRSADSVEAGMGVESDEDEAILDTIPKKTWLPWQRNAKTEAMAVGSSLEEKRAVGQSPAVPEKPKRPMRLFGFIPSRAEANEFLVDEPISEVADVPIDVGLTKTSGWFGIGGNKAKGTPRETASPTQSTKESPASKESPPREHRRWIPSLGRIQRSSAVPPAKVSPGMEPKPDSPKKSWLPFQNRTPKPTKPPQSSERSNGKPIAAQPASASDRKATQRVASRIFGWLDGLKLKPPVDESPIAPSPTSNQAPQASGPKPIVATGVPIPSTSTKAAPTPSPAPNDEEEDGSQDYRHLSKAERKRLRRQNGNDRYAA